MVLWLNLVYYSSLFYPMLKNFLYFLKCWFLTRHPVFKYFLRRHHVLECFWGVTGCFWPGLTTIATKHVSLEFTGEIGKPSDVFYYMKLRCILYGSFSLYRIVFKTIVFWKSSSFGQRKYRSFLIFDDH